MDIITVRSQIKNKTPDSFYIFTGSEWAVRQIYVQKIAQCVGFSTVYCNSVADVFGKLKNKSIFNKPVCYVIREDVEFTKTETAWQKVESLLDKNILILEFSSVDKRGKFYKHYKDRITMFDRLSDDVLIKYIQREISLSSSNCKRLIDICDGSYGYILLEIDKIKHLQGLPDAAFETLLQEGVIYQPPKDVMFDWVDAVLKRRVNQAFHLYSQCQQKEVVPLVMLSVLFNNVKQVLQVQDCIREGTNIETSTGLTGYQVKLVKEKCGFYSIGELVYMLRKIREAEVGIKTGKLEDKTVVPLLMVQIL